ncbi:hypothetical protein Terro_3332 [Terriglobus roseus DSM 18391]|uniref:Lipoprotein n=1 Tax=Terriglobus roseus (strain DSM 18391 / NRRL B-41598 / KBS 63) TaxID=926566 RepID=I3ZJY1_TERRK|nr:hypothetical protein [Terriglobus roseus]AFL89549.1 hypothetical protein Terro_3332 [Terriglobus roseus DSM 18391]
MLAPRSRFRSRQSCVALAITGIVLLGCARKVQIEVPANFHGHVRILCNGLTEDRSTNIHVDASGAVNATTCPVRQTGTVISRAGESAPVDANVMWTTTGDGLVREITFDVR